jgi:hypothetical protein
VCCRQMKRKREGNADVDSRWCCGACTFDNPSKARVCGVCKAKRDGGGGGGGGWPCGACTYNNLGTAKRCKICQVPRPSRSATQSPKKAPASPSSAVKASSSVAAGSAGTTPTKTKSPTKSPSKRRPSYSWLRSSVWKGYDQELFDRCVGLQDSQLRSPVMLQRFGIAAFANQAVLGNRISTDGEQ